MSDTAILVLGLGGIAVLGLVLYEVLKPPPPPPPNPLGGLGSLVGALLGGL